MINNILNLVKNFFYTDNKYKTPCEKLGYKVGDKFRVTDSIYKIPKDWVLILVEDDGTDDPLFRTLFKVRDNKYYVQSHILLSHVEPYIEEMEKTYNNTIKFNPESLRRIREYGHNIIEEETMYLYMPEKTPDKLTNKYVGSWSLETSKGWLNDVLPVYWTGKDYIAEYFGVFLNANASMEHIKLGILEDGVVYTSRYRHEFIRTPKGLFIDGGMEYLRSSTMDIVKFKVFEGNFYLVNEPHHILDLLYTYPGD